LGVLIAGCNYSLATAIKVYIVHTKQPGRVVVVIVKQLAAVGRPGDINVAIIAVCNILLAGSVIVHCSKIFYVATAIALGGVSEHRIARGIRNACVVGGSATGNLLYVATIVMHGAHLLYASTVQTNERQLAAVRAPGGQSALRSAIGECGDTATIGIHDIDGSLCRKIGRFARICNLSTIRRPSRRGVCGSGVGSERRLIRPIGVHDEYLVRCASISHVCNLSTIRRPSRERIISAAVMSKLLNIGAISVARIYLHIAVAILARIGNSAIADCADNRLWGKYWPGNCA